MAQATSGLVARLGEVVRVVKSAILKTMPKDHSLPKSANSRLDLLEPPTK